MAYDSARWKTVLFGGAGTTVLLGDTWEWDGSTWQPQIWAAGPSARHGHSMAFDSRHGRTILFGGYDGSYLGDTWEWDGTTWSQTTTIGPAARVGHAMAYDSQRGRTVLFGGSILGGAPVGDTWEWDGNNWYPAATGPSARHRPAMTYDSQRARTVLFGGSLPGSVFAGDTWEWDGTSWTQAATTGPQPRLGHAMAFDGQSGRSVLFGGYDANYLPETWEWDGASWTQVATIGPSPRHSHSMAHDDHRGRTVLFGGYDSSMAHSSDTWEWNGGTQSSAAVFGLGCGNPILDLSQVVNARPTIGTTAQVALANIPTSPAFIAVGWSNSTAGAFTLPLSLAGFGMPGCHLLQSADAAAQPTLSTGASTALYSLPLPNWTGLIGAHIYLQGWAYAPGANAGSTIVSNGVAWGIGNS